VYLKKIVGFNLIKYFIGIILTCLGISFNETLSAIKNLKVISNYVLEKLLEYTPFYFDKITERIIIPNISDVNMDENILMKTDKNNYLLPALGIFFLGITGIIATLFIIDISVPELSP
jgi:hypothetical protein